MPKVSVLLPVYKTNEEYLKEAIASILAQTFNDFELLILDDCPEDSRKGVIQSYNDGRIKYIQNEKNLGISLSRNKLIDLAEGEYLAIMDHDDVSLPKRFEEEVKFLDTHPDYGVVSCASGQMINGSVIRPPTDDHDIKIALCAQCVILHPAAMIRKQVLIDNNIRYEERFFPCEDYALWCKLIKHTRFHNIPEVLFAYRNHSNNTTHTQSLKMGDAEIEIHSFVAAENPSLYREFLFRATHATRIRLFGFIPILTIVSKGQKAGYRVVVYLFARIPLFVCRKRTKI